MSSGVSAAEVRLASRAAARLRPFGLGPYAEILELQEQLRERRQRDEVEDVWLLGEHPTVITEGARSRPGDVIGIGCAPAAAGVFKVDRGGMTTLHSPGQLILYPIVKLEGGSLAAGRLARALLEAMREWIRVEFGVEAETHPRAPGLYVGAKKLMSIGISVRSGVSMHGVALNMCNDLGLWGAIVPCGDASTEPVSISQLVGRRVEPGGQAESIARWLGERWGYERVLRD